MARLWTDVVREKRAIRNQKLAKTYGEDAPSDPRIFAARDIQGLLNLLQDREVTTEAIVLAHIAKAGSTLGYVGRAFHPAESDSVLVAVLRKLGAVIIAKTNLPQSILVAPREARVLSWLSEARRSALGWGTDIGGSIRIPSHMNGLWGLKPSSGRFSYEGVEVSQDGQHQIPSAVGPMARTLNTLTLASKAVIEAACWTLDPQMPPMPWRDDVFQQYSQKSLVVGIMVDDGMVKVHPPVERVFDEVCQKLEAAGHELIPWDTSLNADCIKLMDAHYVVDGGEDIRRDVGAGGEPFLPHVQGLVERGPAISVYEYWQLNKRKKAAQAAYNQMWNAMKSSSGRPVDVLIVPTMPRTAVPHRALRWPGYTKLFNFLDYTALSFPAGKASKVLDPSLPTGYEPRNATDAWNWGLYDIEAIDGHSVGLHIVGRRLQEEMVLGIAHQIQKIL
ncbi:amidase [Microdochium trichocladiopsis]|uniref:Amidase n=1 Tax=Microdochium trichocladiopsis TaxID=1682393 RepID=A0A9P9C0W3_9PEZI|nr:amidase [Microdochium trichocladiopsis]KAH7041519.1 amidase [Microdochium trichocladiopsis]